MRLRILSQITLVLALLAATAAGCTKTRDPRPDPGGDGPATDGQAVADPDAAELTVIKWSGEFSDGWKQVDKLIDEQKFETATKLVEDMLEGAKQKQASEEWVRCLIRMVQLRTSLHGYETAVQFLREQPWPEDLLASTTLNLYYVASLSLYARSYSWEIRQREKVASKGPVDLKAWTMEQIYSEAHKAYAEVYAHRDQLGDFPKVALEAYVRPNTFPEGIRPTLRDAVTYLWTELLADTQGWRPEQSNQIYQLDLAALLSGQAGGRLELTDPAIHPLRKIAFLLDDLERWHASAGRPQAAFEARLERLRRLHASFTDEAPRAKIRADLERRLPGIRKQPWWAMGMAQRAEFVRAESAPDNLVRARKIALAGAQAYPTSVGGKRCEHIVASIQAPAYSIAAMATDAPGKRSIAVDHKNLDAIHFRAWRLDLQKQIETADDYSIFPDQRKIQKLVAGREPRHRWKVDLTRPPDYKQHRTFVTPPMTEPGLYAVAASAREDFAPDGNVLQGAWFIVGDLVVVSRVENGDLQAGVLSGSTGKPVPGAQVTLYQHDWRKGHQVMGRRTTPASGWVEFPGTNRGGSHFLFAKKGDQVALDPAYLNLYRQSGPRDFDASLLFTDRSIYRPHQTIHFKVVAYHGKANRESFHTVPQRKLTITLKDPNYQTVATKEVTTNAFGTASGSFQVPAGRLMGQWRIESNYNGQAFVRVEEYKRPTFEVEMLDPDRPLRLNRQAVLKGKAKYYFGLPVGTGQVLWTVVRTPVYPWWWGYYWGGSGGVQAQTVATGSAKLGEDGVFEIAFTPEADETRGRELSYSYQVTADVTDEGGETRSAGRSFRLGFVAVEARLEMESGFLRAGQPIEVTLRRTDLNGAPAPGKGRYSLVALRTPAKTQLPAELPILRAPGQQDDDAFRSPGDQLRPRWNPNYQPAAVMRAWTDGGRQASGGLVHDEKGKAKLGLPGLKPGAYRLRYETTDAFGAKYETQREFTVAGTRTELPLPALLLVEQPSVKVGQTARVLALSGLDDQQVFLEIYRKGKLKERRQVDADQGANLFEFPITEADRGGFGLTLVALRDHQLMQFSSSIYVPWDDKELKVAFATFRDKLRPGQQETWTVKLTRPDGKPVAKAAAEVLAYMYDRSLDAFASHNPPSPLSLYPNWSAAAGWRSSLGAATQFWLQSNGFGSLPGYPTPEPDRLTFFERYGIGGLGRRGRGVRLERNRMALRSSAAAAPSPDMAQSASDDLANGDSGLVDMKNKSGKLDEAEKRSAEETAQPTQVSGGDQAAPQVELRTNFSETAFFQPHLLTDADGAVQIQFQVPDSVTSWNVWIHALTKDLKAGSLKKEARTVKELMVRPYLPRFLREGDKATLKVVVNNASERKLEGSLDFDIIDPDTEKSLLADFGLSKADAAGKPFSVKAGGSTSLSFAVTTPARVGLIAFKVTATSGAISDGELRPIPVLPGRMHLAQSRFKVLKDKMRQELHFDDMEKDDDPTLIHEQLVVTLDAQLFYSVLSALPYLVNYPYECTEQTLNRFLSTGILTSMYDDYPAVARMAEKMSQRDTRLERWDDNDPNRKMALEETPWLQQAQGGRDTGLPLVNVLDPRIATAHRIAALNKLKKAQTSAGAFPWFAGGPPSPYMTLYILHGFSKGLEFGVDIPKDVVQKAWRYMHRHYVNEIVNHCMAHDVCWELVTFINYVLSNYPDTTWTGGVFSEGERDRMLAFSFKHWKQHAPYLKAYLALTLARRDRKADSRLVWESVMDSAEQTEDQGTFWAPEDRAWLWYNDTIETHAFALKTSMELTPEDPKNDGMVLWLFINKKLNHWKSTRATAEVIYSLASYLKKTGKLGTREETVVTVGDEQKTFVFEPDEYTGKKNQIVIPGPEIDPKKDSTVSVELKTPGYQFASATWHFSTEKLPTEARGDYLRVERTFFRRVKTGREVTLEPLAEGAKIAVGDEVEVHLSLRAKHKMEYVHLRDPRPAGFEPTSQVSRHQWKLGLYYYEEVRDSGQNFFFEHLPVGEYPFRHRIRATVAGTFKAAPATVQPMYAPEFVGYSSGRIIEIKPAAD